MDLVGEEDAATCGGECCQVPEPGRDHSAGLQATRCACTSGGAGVLGGLGRCQCGHVYEAAKERPAACGGWPVCTMMGRGGLRQELLLHKAGATQSQQSPVCTRGGPCCQGNAVTGPPFSSQCSTDLLPLLSIF